MFDEAFHVDEVSEIRVMDGGVGLTGCVGDCGRVLCFYIQGALIQSPEAFIEAGTRRQMTFISHHGARHLIFL